METKYHDIQGQYDLLKLDLDESVQKSQRLEKQLRVAQAANLANQTGQPLTKQPSKKIVYQNTVSLKTFEVFLIFICGSKLIVFYR